MSWSDRGAALAFGALALAGCAFTPLYGPGGAGAALDGRVAIAAPATPREFLVARELERAFGSPTDPAYRLDYRVSVAAEGAAITSGQEIGRVNLIGTLRYTLRTLPGGAIAAQGTADGFVSYSSAGTPIAINAAREDAELRLARILADRTAVFVLSGPVAPPGTAAPTPTPAP